MNSITDVIHAIEAAKRIAITTHIRPDGDAIGSVLGLRRTLAAAGRSASIVAMDPPSRRYAFLMADDHIIPAGETGPEAFDLLIILDTGALDRAPAAIGPWMSRVRTLNIDHHPTNTGFADLNYVVPSASSTGEMISDLAIAAGYTIPPDAAEALWVALITDTGRFSFSNTTRAAMQTAAALLDTGIRTDRLNHRIYETATADQIRLQGRAIEHLELHREGRIALVSLSLDDFAEFHCTGEDADEMVAVPRRVSGADIAIFLYELPGERRGETKASIRTEEPFNAADLCRLLGGGGHARAAGCSLKMTLASARERILDLIAETWFPA